MKKQTILALTLVLSLLLGSVAMATTATEEKLLPMCQSVPDPEQEPCIYTGDAYFECGQLGLDDLDWAKRVGPQSREWILMDQGDLVEVVSTDVNGQRTEFDWWVGALEIPDDYDPVGAVLVKAEGKGMLPGGDIPKLGGYTIFIYDPPVYQDSGLYSYYREMGNITKDYQIDHITFCWTHVDENGNEVCYQEETAWADGLGYIGANQWAMYVIYDPAGLTVDIWAGQNMLAGTATFSAPVNGEVTITINLIDGWVFYYDPGDTEEDENLKVQDYEFIPEGNPAIGLFDWKESVEPGSTTATIVVPENNYYGVHLDVAYPDECPE